MVVTRSKNDTTDKNSNQLVPSSLNRNAPTSSPESLDLLYKNYYRVFRSHERFKRYLHSVDSCLKDIPPRIDSLETKFLQIKTKLHNKFDVPRGEIYPNESFCPYQDCEDNSYTDSSVESVSELIPNYEYGDIVLILDSYFKDEIGRMFKVVSVDNVHREVVVDRSVTNTTAKFHFKAIMLVSKACPKENFFSYKTKKRKMNASSNEEE